MIKCLLLVFLLSFSLLCRSQVSPAEGKALHYLITRFSFPDRPGTAAYKLEIAKGNCTSKAEFDKNIVASAIGSKRTIVAEVPEFGQNYTWRVQYASKQNGKSFGELYHFNTLMAPNADINVNRLRIKTEATKFKDAFVFSDKNRVLYNMKGKPVWFLPVIPGVITHDVRDLKMTPQGTITFLTVDMAYEISYEGAVLWKASAAGSMQPGPPHKFHHELTRLGNGHYMVLGMETDLTREQGSNVPPPASNDYGVVIEYDATGKMLWYWNSEPFFRHNYIEKSISIENLASSHMNSFYFDEKGQMLYVSFKNTSQIVKVKYPEGTVLNVYGRFNLPGQFFRQRTDFCEQHACKVSSSGSLYFFNNNMCNLASVPKVMVMEEPASPNDELRELWEYEYPLEGGGQLRKDATSGGNVIELPGGAMFVSMCMPNGNVFIVGKDKQLLWDALLEEFIPGERKWREVSQYRASIIPDRAHLERLILH